MNPIALDEFRAQLIKVLEHHPLEKDELSGFESLAGFQYCRRVHAALWAHNIDPASVNPLEILPSIESVMESLDFRPELDQGDVLEIIVDNWDNIRCPTGSDALEYAAYRASKSTEVAPGDYATKKQSRIASLIWRTLSLLPKIDETVFLSIRNASEIAQVNKDTAHRAIRMLEKNRVIEVATKGKKDRATRYRLRICANGDRGS